MRCSSSGEAIKGNDRPVPGWDAGTLERSGRDDRDNVRVDEGFEFDTHNTHTQGQMEIWSWVLVWPWIRAREREEEVPVSEC